MSTLRDHLDRAKAQHEAARYPGDLAAELLAMAPTELKPAKPVTTNRWFWAMGTSSAVAASLIITFLITSRTPNLPAGLPSSPAPTHSGPNYTGVQPVSGSESLQTPDARRGTPTNRQPSPEVQFANGHDSAGSNKGGSNKPK